MLRVARLLRESGDGPGGQDISSPAMKRTAMTARVEDLLAEVSWLEGLASALVGNREEARDLVQEVWVRTLEERPEGVRNPRAWLARVLRNTLGMHRRAGGTRTTRERAAARPEATTGTGEVVARAESLPFLVGAVLALEEPLCSTVLLRYFDGLSSAAIARRQGVPESTVRNRLAQALGELRLRLGHSRSDWRSSLGLIVCAEEVRSVPLTTGAAVAATLVLCGLGGVWWALRRPSAQEPASSVARVAPLPSVVPTLPVLSPAREPLVASAPVRKSALAAPAAATREESRSTVTPPGVLEVEVLDEGALPDVLLELPELGVELGEVGHAVVVEGEERDELLVLRMLFGERAQSRQTAAHAGVSPVAPELEHDPLAAEVGEARRRRAPRAWLVVTVGQEQPPADLLGESASDHRGQRDESRSQGSSTFHGELLMRLSLRAVPARASAPSGGDAASVLAAQLRLVFGQRAQADLGAPLVDALRVLEGVDLETVRAEGELRAVALRAAAAHVHAVLEVGQVLRGGVLFRDGRAQERQALLLELDLGVLGEQPGGVGLWRGLFGNPSSRARPRSTARCWSGASQCSAWGLGAAWRARRPG